jgi:cytochrome c oxidase subunit IV
MRLPEYARAPTLSWLALLTLLAITCGGAFLPLGAFNLVLGLAIATTKTTIVLTVFMKLQRSPPLAWIYAGAGIFWLMLMLGLSGADYLTRQMLLISGR